jgi:hypothetical protein
MPRRKRRAAGKKGERRKRKVERKAEEQDSGLGKTSRPMAGNKSVDAKGAENSKKGFTSIPSLQYRLEGCARRVPLRGTQRKPRCGKVEARSLERLAGICAVAHSRIVWILFCVLCALCGKEFGFQSVVRQEPK